MKQFASGDSVQTPLGKGVIREVRNSGRLVVEVQGRAIVLTEREVSALVSPRTARARPGANTGRSGTPSVLRRPRIAAREIDLHGLRVEDALARVESALNDALLSDEDELRLIHGRSGGRLKAAVHQRLRELPAVRSFHVDPRNPGVTVVSL